MTLIHKDCEGRVAYDTVAGPILVRESATLDSLVRIPAGYEWIPGLVCSGCQAKVEEEHNVEQIC